MGLEFALYTRTLQKDAIITGIKQSSQIIPPFRFYQLLSQLQEHVLISLAMNNDKDILLHICCAPDGSIPVPDLQSEGWNVEGFFYGSNIHPQEEYTRRLEAVRVLAAHCGISCVIGRYSPEEWLEGVKGLESEPEGGRRCERCFTLQLEACAREAVRLGREWICTTLTISPHKNATLINEIGESVAEKFGLRWESRIWRKKDGFLRSVRASRELGLYRQNYCGCTFSM